jgi:hypothetical protein
VKSNFISQEQNIIYHRSKLQRNWYKYNTIICNVLGGSIHDGTLLLSKSQYTTVKHSQKLFEHTYTSDPHGLGTLLPIEFFQQDLLRQSFNTHSHSCSQKASIHTRSIRRRAIGPLAHHNGTSAYSPSLACHLPAPPIECLHRPPYKLTCSSRNFPIYIYIYIYIYILSSIFKDCRSTGGPRSTFCSGLVYTVLNFYRNTWTYVLRVFFLLCWSNCFFFLKLIADRQNTIDAEGLDFILQKLIT